MTKKTKQTIMPMVSICTPTFNRRPFIPILFECFRNQTYPKSRIEWIIVDDGTDKIEDLVVSANIPQIKYFPIDKKMTLGAKRNLLHEKTKGSIIVNMDDDDYYPPERISHAVETLLANPHALCAATSEIYLYFKNLKKIYQFGPYGPNHGTAATFAIRRELINISRYDDNVSLAEERNFLKDYTVPMVQLDPLKTILVFAHNHNSVDKREHLKAPDLFIKESNKKIEMFIKNSYENKIKKFFMEDMEEILKKYEAGEPKMKPDVLKDLERVKRERALQAQTQSQQQTQIMMQRPGEEPVPLGLSDMVNIINQQQDQMRQMLTHIKDLETMVTNLQKNIISEKLKNNTKSSELLTAEGLNNPTTNDEVLILREELEARKIVEQKLYTQIKLLIQKNLGNTMRDPLDNTMLDPLTPIIPSTNTKQLLPNPLKEISKFEPEFKIKI